MAASQVGLLCCDLKQSQKRFKYILLPVCCWLVSLPPVAVASCVNVLHAKLPQLHHW
jgi:hypothetical protein